MSSVNSTHCKRASCKNGDCIGCLNGQRNCLDSRCHPKCPECEEPRNQGLSVVMIVVVVLLAIFVIGLIIFSYTKGLEQEMRINSIYHNHPETLSYLGRTHPVHTF